MYVTIVRIKLRFSKDLMIPFYYYRSYAFTTGAKMNLTITSGLTGLGVQITKNLNLTKNGTWSTIMEKEASTVPCALSFEYEGKMRTHEVTHAPVNCLK